MIGYLRGDVMDKPQPGRFVIDVNGVGYDVETSLATFFQLDAQPAAVALHIHTIVREDALLLYGFADKAERSLFRALIKVNGVGPKLAMTILSSISPHEFIEQVRRENIAFLIRIPGVGKKTAERLLVEMKDSVQQLSVNKSVASLAQLPRSHQDEASSALEALGYKPQDVVKAMNKLDTNQHGCEELIKQALQILSHR